MKRGREGEGGRERETTAGGGGRGTDRLVRRGRVRESHLFLLPFYD